MPNPTGRAVCATTLRIPNAVYEQAKQILEMERSDASLNDFFVSAIQAYVKLCERKRIDAEFAAMADDVKYQAEAVKIAEDFAAIDWEAFALMEQREDVG